jgi:hypothetical protein
LVSFDNNNPETTEKIHFIDQVQGFPYHFLIVGAEVGDCGEAYLGAECGKKMCLLMKNTSIASSTFWWSLINSVGTLTMLCVILVAFFRTVFPFIFNTDRPQIASAAFASSVVTSHPGIPPVLTIARKSAVDG